jgi:uncharacterized protein (DUF305 family)
VLGTGFDNSEISSQFHIGVESWIVRALCQKLISADPRLLIHRSKKMSSMMFRHTTQFLALLISSIALSTGVSACNSASQSATTPAAPPIAKSTPAATMDHSGMNHDAMKGEGMKPDGMTHNMDLGPADADYDLRFIDAMIPHHEGALVMAQDLAQKTKRPELQKLAKDIISAQTKEIAQMKQWRQGWYPKAPSTPMAWHPEMKHMMAMKPEQISAMKMDMDLGKADAEYDLRFLKAMVPHHQAAVVMAKDLAQKTKRPELQKLAKDVITSQQAEIDQMQQWQKSWYAK